MTGNEEIVRTNREYTFFPWTSQAAVDPIPVERSQGVYLWDPEGRRYLDFCSQLMNVNAGHGHPHIVSAIKEQAETLAYAAPSFATRVRGELGRMVAKVAPGNLNKTFFTLGGAEATENAIKIARMVTGRNKIVTRYRSYHGATYGALSAGGNPRRLPVEPGIPGIVRVFDPYCYRCVFGKEPDSCGRECISHVEEVIQFEGPGNVAALMFEGVTGTSGLFVPPDDYWPRMRAICDKYGILLIADEVMSGWGRTGEWFAVDNWGVVPDIIATAKGITSGYLPLGAVIVSDRIAEYFEDKPFWAGLTCSGHPMSCAAGIAALEVLEQEGLLANARSVGGYLSEGLFALQERHPSLGDVRGLGLFQILELVRNRETREPMVPWNAKGDEMERMQPVTRHLRQQGVYAFVKWNTIYACPPLCITPDEVDEGLAALDSALEITDGFVNGG
jgi:taurine--2-oxoglutarate transaminase